MRVAEPIFSSWKARLDLGFDFHDGKTTLATKRFEGPLAVQKPLYPEGEGVCHAIVVHPPGGIAGGDELSIGTTSGGGAHALLTTPGAGKWYRTAGPAARQTLHFEVGDGIVEWLPRETIVFDGAVASLETRVVLGGRGGYVGWEVVCLGRAGSGERFERGGLQLSTEIAREGKLLWRERGRVDGALMRSPAGLSSRTVFGTLVATLPQDAAAPVLAKCREAAAVTLLPGLLVARVLGDSGEKALQAFTRIWKLVRPLVAGREAVEPRIWST